MAWHGQGCGLKVNKPSFAIQVSMYEIFHASRLYQDQNIAFRYIPSSESDRRALSVPIHASGISFLPLLQQTQHQEILCASSPTMTQSHQDILETLLEVQNDHELSIIKLSEPVSGQLKQNGGKERTSDVSTDVFDNPTPASLEADLTHYKVRRMPQILKLIWG